MSKNNWREQDAWPIFQTAVSWLSVILFIAIVGGKGFIQETIEHSRERAKTTIFPATPKYDQLMSEMETLVDSVKQAAKNGTLTINKAAEAQMEAISRCAKVEKPWGGFTAEICDIARRNFTDSWVPPAEMSDDMVDFMNKYPERKRQHIEMSFGREWMLAQNEARMLFPETRPISITCEQWLGLLKWLAKWYWLLTIPSLFIFLFNRKCKGESIREELVLQPRRLILACLAGPFGLIAISETVARVRRYRQLASEVYARTGRWYLTDTEEQAIIRQLEEPLLQFDQALDAVLNSSERLRRPLTVCVIAWMMGLLHQPMIRQLCSTEIVQEMTLVVSQDTVKNASNNKTLSGVELLLAILPADVVWQFETQQKEVLNAEKEVPRDVLWEAVLARGPPPAAEEQLLLINSFALGCITQKG